MVTHKRYSLGFVVLVLVFVSLLTGCSQGSVSQVDVMDRPGVLYLTEPVSPCALIEGSGRDPCALGRPARVESSTSASGWPIWVSSGAMPSYTEVLLGYNLPAIAPHIVIRGVPLSGSTRCGLYSLEDYSYEVDTLGWSNAYHYYCFSEVMVREYIVGSGPPTLPVILGLDLHGLSEEDAADWQADNNDGLKVRTADAYEGKELILFLMPSLTIEVEAWHALSGSTSFWFVQRRGDEIRAVSVDVELADTAEERAALDMPLDDLVVKIKAAAVERQQLTGGRVGITAVDGAVAADGEGERFPAAEGVRAGATLPMLVTDGNKLQEYYVAAGAVYKGEGKTTVLPPSPPADFVPPSTTTAPSTTTTVSASTTSSTVETTTSTTVAPSSTTTTSDPSTTTSTIPEPSTTTSVPATSTTVVATSTTVVSTTTSTTATVPTTTTSTSTVPSTTTTTAADGLSISVSDASATEGELLVSNVTLSEEPYRQVSVNYDVRDVTAESGVDYQSPAGTFLFGPFDVRKTVRVYLVNDSTKEEAETFQLVLSDPYGASIAKPVGTGTILDND